MHNTNTISSPAPTLGDALNNLSQVYSPGEIAVAVQTMARREPDLLAYHTARSLLRSPDLAVYLLALRIVRGADKEVRQ